MSKIDDIDCMEPHLTGELICLKCGYRYIGTWNEKVWLKDLYCPNCQTQGFNIATGQILESGDLSEFDKEHPKKMNKPGLIINFPGKGGGLNGNINESGHQSDEF